jgi:hypothetical protein
VAIRKNMRKNYWKILFVLCFALYIPLQSLAWGAIGHRIVGEIAESYLSKQARAEIKKILGDESLAMSSTWADFIKSDPSYKYLDIWHYINFKKGMSHSEMQQFLAKDTAVNAYTRINFLVQELKKKDLTPDSKKMYLRLLVHLIGDIHQPLHVSPEGTSGGNDIKVSWFSQASNLHRVWDSQIIEQQQLSFTEYVKAINFASPSQRKSWQSSSLGDWLFESYNIAQKLHDDIKDPNPRLGYEYNYVHIDTVNDQLLKGGVRLAGVLNQIFSK